MDSYEHDQEVIDAWNLERTYVMTDNKENAAAVQAVLYLTDKSYFKDL